MVYRYKDKAGVVMVKELAIKGETDKEVMGADGAHVDSSISDISKVIVFTTVETNGHYVQDATAS